MKALVSRPRPSGATPTEPRAHRSPWLIATLGILIVAGAWLRFSSLDRLSFWADEFPHAIAATSLMEDGRPVLPSGMEYRRALAQTVAVAASMRAFGEGEGAARIPSALIGLVTIPALWFVARRRFGVAAATAAAAVLALMPLHVDHSRSARFYVAFALAYPAAAMLGSRALATGSRRDAALGLAAGAIAVHFQISALMVVAPLAVQAVVQWLRAPEHRAAAYRKRVTALAGLAVLGLAVVIVVPSVRDTVTRMVERPVPGLELRPGIHLETIGTLFGVVAWWAWIPLAPAAIIGIRRAGRAGMMLALHLLVPAGLLTVLFASTSGGGVDSRYLIHLVPFVAAVAGIGVAEAGRIAWRRLSRIRPGTVAPEPRAGIVAAALAGALVVSGIASVWSVPGEAHPGSLTPHPNWNAAGAILRARSQPGDALLSSSPLSTAWVAGRCGDWLRSVEAARPYMDGATDIYCGSRLVPDAASATAYLAANPTGWLVADPQHWEKYVDGTTRTIFDSVSTRVPVSDGSILVMRWDLTATEPSSNS